MARTSRKRRKRNAETRSVPSADSIGNFSAFEPNLHLTPLPRGRHSALDPRENVRKAPETIFKYAPQTLQSIQNLKSQIIYFGSPSQFNDPYDCAITAQIEEPTDAEVEQMRSVYLEDPGTQFGHKRQLRAMSVEQLRPMLTKAARSVLDDQREKFLKIRGIACFTETNDNLLLWSHYASACHGYCLEFCTELLEPKKLWPVIYAERIPRINVVPIVVNSDPRQVMDLFRTKSAAWSYEREWRYVHSEAGTPFSYPPQALKAVYLGPEIDDQSRDLICIILAAQNPTVELWLGKRSETEFKAEFRLAGDYTPLTLAKTKGWVLE